MQLVRLSRFVLRDEQWKGTENAICCRGNNNKSCRGTTIFWFPCRFKRWQYTLCMVLFFIQTPCCQPAVIIDNGSGHVKASCFHHFCFERPLPLSILFRSGPLGLLDQFLAHLFCIQWTFPGWNRWWRSPTLHFPCSGWKTEAWCDDARTCHINTSDCLVSNCFILQWMQCMHAMYATNVS